MANFSLALLAAVVVALLAFGGVPSSSAKHRKASSNGGHQHPLSAPAFASGREYRFRYDAQVASGYASWISTQRAMGRLQAQVSVTFKSSSGSDAVLRMSECRYGQLNGFPHIEEWNPARIQPMNIFESTGADDAKFNDQLEMPIQFKYEDGLITKIYFHDNEPTWSKNIKKGVLNMFQVNLKRQQVESDQDPNEQKVEQELRKQSGKSTQSDDDQQKTFTVTEASVEGVCETVYTVSAMSKSRMNVTKSVNFDRCQMLVDTAYGTQVDELLPSAAQQLHQQDRLEEVPMWPAWTNRSSLPRQTLDRSTTIRYELVDADRQGGSRCELKRAELLSIYVLKGMDAEASQAMQTVASAQLELVAVDGEPVDENNNENGRGEDQEDQRSSQQQQRKANNNKKAAKKDADNNAMPSTEGEGEALLYNADLEAQEKLFYMFGDEQKTKDQAKSPNADQQQQQQLFPLNFPNSESKIKRVKECLNQVAEANSNEFNAGENRALKVAEDLDELVQVLRYCTMDELAKIQKDTTSKTDEWFMDGLAAAGTRNTLKFLVDRIQKAESGHRLKEWKVAQLLKMIGRGSGLAAVSDRIADIVLSLCKTEQMQASKLLKQACWLSFGTIVGELQQQTRRAKATVRTPISADEMCPQHKTDLYKQVLIEQLKAAQSSADVYEQVVALKAIGNAALESATDDVVAVIADHAHSPMVRAHAIDALRRVMNSPQNCEKIHRLLMPVFQNAAEKPEVRMAAFARIMNSGKMPQADIVDQIAYTLANGERCPQVEAYVYSTVKALANSPIPEDQHRASHLMNALRLADVSEEELEQKPRASAYSRTAFFSRETKEGVFMDVQSIFAGSAHGGGPALPAHFSLALDTLFNGQMVKDKLKLSLCQKDIEQAIKRILSIDGDENGDNDADSDDNGEQQQKKGILASAAAQLRSIFSKLGIRGHDSANGDQHSGPMAMVSLRVNNVDTIVFPIGGGGDQSSASASANGFDGVKAFLYRIIGSSAGPNAEPLLDVRGILTWRGRSARIPTSVGMQLKVSQTSFSYGAMKAELKMQGHSQLSLSFQPTITVSAIQKMKIWGMPTHGSGIKCVIAGETKLPIEGSVQQITGNGQQKQLKMSMRIPQQKIRLFALHSLPMTFVTETDASARRDLSQGERVKAIVNNQLQSQARDMQFTIGEKALQMPLTIHGVYHMPRKIDSLKELAKVAAASENHFHVDFTPVDGETPREMTLNFVADLFSAHANTPSASLRPRLQDFQDKFQSQFSNGKRNNGPSSGFSSSSEGSSSSAVSADDETIDKEYLETRRQQQMRNINGYLDKYAAEKAYKHSLKVIAETVGGSKTKRAEMQLEGVCDAKFQTCESRVNIERSAMLADEKAPWTMEAQAHVYYPETVSDIEDLPQEQSQQQSQQKFICRAQIEWGAKNAQKQQRQSIKLDVQGEPSEEMLEKVAKQQKQRYNNPSDGRSDSRYQGNQQPQRSSPFVNAYAAVADYRLKPSAQKLFVRALETAKAAYFWNTESRIIFNGQNKNAGSMIIASGTTANGAATGRVSAQLQLEPTCGGAEQYANVTVRTPGQWVRIESVALPAKFCPMPLVRSAPSIRPAHSVSQLLASMGVMASRGECRLDGASGQLRSFDGANYAAPMSKCYTVLAKDCQSGQDTPRYVVLMKSVAGSGGKQRKLKVITRERVIEAEPHPTEPHQLLVKVNDQRFTAAEIESAQRDQSPAASANVDGIEFSTGYAATKGGKRPSVIIEDAILSVRFNGVTARIQLNGKYKRAQCGLCGNYDGDATNDWRKANGQVAADLKAFHESYALQDTEEAGCTVDEQNKFYARFNAIANAKNGNGIGQQQQQQVNSDNSQDDEGAYDRSEDRSEEPIAMTKVMEFNHKVCFSLKPVKQCPAGTFPAANGIAGSGNEQQEQGQEQQQPMHAKVQFTCLDRHSLEAKRLKQQVRRENIAAAIFDYPASFQEVVTIPERCIPY